MKTDTPMKDPIKSDFDARQHEAGLALAATSDLLELAPLPGPGSAPDRYLVQLRTRGLARDAAGRIVEHDLWTFGIWLPPNYLRGGFHPGEIVTYLGPMREPWHPQIRTPHVCLLIRPGMPLTELLLTLHDLISWNLYSTHDEGLNHPASQWSRHQPASRFPVDRRPLRRRPAPVAGLGPASAISDNPNSRPPTA